MSYRPNTPEGLKPKDLIGVAWMVAMALQTDGWYLRSDIIWHKPNCQPESVKDRVTVSHEYLFMFSKSENYYFDQEAPSSNTGLFAALLCSSIGLRRTLLNFRVTADRLGHGLARKSSVRANHPSGRDFEQGLAETRCGQ